jgi:hypothetical protein
MPPPVRIRNHRSKPMIRKSPLLLILLTGIARFLAAIENDKTSVIK